MKNQDYYRIVPLEMSISLIAMIVGVGILTISRSLAQELDTPDGWISIGISGLMVMVLVYLYTRLQQHFPGQNLLQFLAKGSIGKWLAKLFAIFFIIYFVTVFAFEVRTLAIVIEMYLLNQTPQEVVIASILLLSTYAVSKGTQGIIHLNIMFVPITLFIVLVMLVFNLPSFKFEELRPIMAEGIVPIITGVKLTIVSFLGIETLFFFMANMKKSDLRALPLNISIGVITLIYILVTICSYSVFTLPATKFITFPMLELAKEIELPGAFFERLESLMMTVWIMSIFNTMAIVQLLAVQIIKQEILPTKKGTHLPTIIIFFVFIIAFNPNSINEVFTMGDWVGRLGVTLFIFGLLAGFITVWIRNKMKGRMNQEVEG
jgi:spore germination protein